VSDQPGGLPKPPITITPRQSNGSS